jgi:hypothetical protein
MNDPFEDGSDNAAFFVATGSRTLAGRTMIRAYGAELEASASFDDGEARLAAIARVGVHEIIHDWKWLDCEADVSKLRQLGVRVQQLAETSLELAAEAWFYRRDAVVDEQLSIQGLTTDVDAHVVDPCCFVGGQRPSARRGF